jgi:hypothetical protein
MLADEVRIKTRSVRAPHLNERRAARKSLPDTAPYFLALEDDREAVM